MKKVFALLLAELRKLGANIIFANFSKVIIDTGKFDLSAAKAYCDSLLKALQTRFFFLTGWYSNSYSVQVPLYVSFSLLCVGTYLSGLSSNNWTSGFPCFLWIRFGHSYSFRLLLIDFNFWVYRLKVLFII